MDKKIRILVVPSDNYGCGRFRSIWPHAYIQEHYSDQFDIDIIFAKDFPQMPLDKFINQYDIIHIHKMMDKDGQFVKMAKYLGKKVIIDIDDHYDLGFDHPMSISAKKEHWAEPIIKHLQLADYVTTTTDIFAKILKKHNKNVAVFPNAIDPDAEQFKPNPTKSDKIRFGIICGSSHLNDIKLLDGMVNRLPKDVKDKVQFVLCGFDTNGTKTIYFPDGHTEKRAILPQESVWYDYEKILTDNYKICSDKYKQFLHMFVKNADYPNVNEEGYRRCWTKDIEQYCQHYNNIDVLLVPLKENEFNSVKSELKFIEAGFFHKAVIAQNFGPYTIGSKSMFEKGNVFNEDGNCILINSSKNHKDWAKYVEKLVKNPELIDKLGENMYNHVKDRYNIATVASDRVKFYKELMGV